MSDANQTTNLEQFPDSAIEVVHGKVQRLNRIAMHRFPELRSGMELPGFLSTPLKDPDGAGRAFCTCSAGWLEQRAVCCWCGPPPSPA